MRVRAFVNTILAWAWPRTCLLCDAVTGAQDFCAACRRELPYAEHACRQCAPRLPASADALVCGRCQQRPPPFFRTVAAFLYRPPLAALVQRLKYSGDIVLARSLGELLAMRIAGAGTDAEWIVPVPLHRQRVRRRGYNQAMELARPVARRLGLPLRPHLVRRVKATRPQTRLARDARRSNMRRAFIADAAVAGRRIAIVDDVMTSGHTAAALSATLLAAGAKSVEVWVLARA